MLVICTFYSPNKGTSQHTTYEDIRKFIQHFGKRQVLPTKFKRLPSQLLDSLFDKSDGCRS